MTGEGPLVRVQRASAADRVVVLEVRVPGRTAFVAVAATREGARTGLLPKGAARERWGGRLPPGAVRRHEREDALEGAEVVALGDAEAWIVQHGELRVVRSQGGHVVVTDAAGRAPPEEALADVLEDEGARARLEARGLELASALAEDGKEIHRSELLDALAKATRKLERRREAVRADLARISEADGIASQAQWLVGEAARAKRGATELVVTDWSSGEARTLRIPLDPAKSAREQVEAMFRRAKRLRLGGRIAEERLAHTEAQLAAVEEAAILVRAATAPTEMDAAAAEAKRAAPRDLSLPGAAAPASGARRPAAGRTPFRTFVAASGTKLLVGKGAADNDALTTKIARPHDLWVHAKDRTGAHVVVVLPKGHTCSGADLVDAAHLAAHFSDVRDEKIVDVQYAERRHVRKPKGSPPGFVLVDREKVLVLRVEPERLRALLDREDLG